MNAVTSRAVTLGAHALGYAAAGLPVLPLRTRGKEPATKHGKDDATTDPDQISAWWAEHPDNNIGVRPPDGFVVIDIDPRNGGEQALTELIAARELPETWSCRTGSGGRHLWYRYPGPNRSKLCTGVDLKDHRGYLVMPPSVHPNGQVYRWENRSPIAHAPAWLHPLLAPPQPVAPAYRPVPGGASSGDALVSFVARAAEGNRNHALFWAANRAAEAGTLTGLAAQLIAAAVATGLDKKAAEATIKSARKRNTR